MHDCMRYFPPYTPTDMDFVDSDVTSYYPQSTMVKQIACNCIFLSGKTAIEMIYFKGLVKRGDKVGYSPKLMIRSLFRMLVKPRISSQGLGDKRLSLGLSSGILSHLRYPG